MLALRTLPAARPPAAGQLLAIHGFLGAGRNLTALARALGERLPDTAVHLVDLPGHGLSPPLGEGADLDDVARAVWAALPAEGAPLPLRLVGHSLGGRVALAMATATATAAAAPGPRAAAGAPPPLVDVVLLDITAAPLDAPAGEMDALFAHVLAADPQVPRREVLRDRLVAAGISRGLADWATTNLQREGDGFTWRIDRAALAGFQKRQRRASLWGAVERLGPRCRLLFGGRSPFVPPADRRRFAQLGARVEEVPEAGHFIHTQALPEVTDFICRAAAR